MRADLTSVQSDVYARENEYLTATPGENQSGEGRKGRLEIKTDGKGVCVSE